MPEQTPLALYRERWSLTARAEGFETNSSWLQRVSYEGRNCVLKVAKPESDERPGMALLAWWRGQGAVAVLERDADAILTAEADETRALGSLDHFTDEAAYKALVQTADALHGAGRARADVPDGLVPLSAVRTHVFTLPALVETCFARWRDFAPTLDLEGPEPMPLHGDIHHGNVLWDPHAGAGAGAGLGHGL